MVNYFLLVLILFFNKLTQHHTFRFIKRALLLLSFTFALLFSSGSHSSHHLQAVLVSAKNSNMKTLEKKDIRRLFLGLRPINIKQTSTPIINTSNPTGYKLFLKNIMFLTERGYERKLIKRVFRQGADRIESFDSIDDLTQHLKQHPDNISFMLKQEALKHPDLKIIQVLW